MMARVGDEMTVRGCLCRVVRVHALGTVDVEEVNGDHAWRVSGLALADEPCGVCGGVASGPDGALCAACAQEAGEYVAALAAETLGGAR